MSRRRVSRTGRCPYCQREYGDRRDICTNPQCRSNQTLVMRYNIQRHAVRIDTPGGTNRERPHTAMAMAFAKALAREEPTVADQRGVKAFSEAEERAREALRAHGGDWHSLPRQSTSDWYLALRARAIQAEDALAALKDNPGYVEVNERESLLAQISNLSEAIEARDRAIQTYQERLSEYADMPDPQETRRRGDELRNALQHAQETVARQQTRLSDYMEEAEDLRAQLAARPNTFTEDQVLQLVMHLARRVHGLEAKLFEQAGIFP